MMARIVHFPHITHSEFHNACEDFCNRFLQTSHLQSSWSSVDNVKSHDTTYLRITKPLSHTKPCAPPSTSSASPEDQESEVEDNVDEEALITQPPSPSQVSILYDIILSPTYRVPALYISIKDRFHRYPPNLSTLYSAIIPPDYAAQTQDFGVIGGITITDHPVSCTPVYFIHPCQTAEVLQASSVDTQIDTSTYLIFWIGAMGKCVGLNVPLALVMAQNVQEEG